MTRNRRQHKKREDEQGFRGDETNEHEDEDADEDDAVAPRVTR